MAYPVLLIQLPEDSKLRSSIQAIHDAGKRASELVADLFTVARSVVAIKEPANINTLVREYLDFPEHQKLKMLYPKITFEIVLEPNLFTISCSPVHIEKCLMNLVTNATEAIKNMVA